MSSEVSIYFDFKRARDQAEALENLANQLKTLSDSNLENTMMGISRNWTGTNANAFLGKANSLQEKIKDTSKDLDNIATDIKRIAKRIYDAEMLAIQIANERRTN